MRVLPAATAACLVAAPADAGHTESECTGIGPNGKKGPAQPYPGPAWIPPKIHHSPDCLHVHNPHDIAAAITLDGVHHVWQLGGMDKKFLVIQEGTTAIPSPSLPIHTV